MIAYKIVLLLAIVLAVSVASRIGDLNDPEWIPSANPTAKSDDASPLDGNVAEGIIVEHIRAKRATCDLLSPFKVGHAACAANCIRRGFRGGFCNDKAVCNCRK